MIKIKLFIPTHQDLSCDLRSLDYVQKQAFTWQIEHNQVRLTMGWHCQRGDIDIKLRQLDSMVAIEKAALILRRKQIEYKEEQ
jgi:hypothetical protein